MGGYPILGSSEFPDYPEVPHNGIYKTDLKPEWWPAGATQDFAKLATAQDLMMNQLGITNPDLHRYIQIHPYTENRIGDFHELGERVYMIGIFGVESHRYTERIVRDYGVLDPMAENPNNILEIP